VLSDLHRPFCLGLTRDGAPRHPLYLARVTRLAPYAPRGSGARRVELSPRLCGST
jgi:hypothetical protein